MTDPTLDFERRWPTLQPPLRPHANVARAVQSLLPDTDFPGDLPVLLLGVTPELAVVADTLVAVDWSPAMISRAWVPCAGTGNGAGRMAICADWLAMPFAPHSFGAVMGDGALTMLCYPHEQPRLFASLAHVVRPGGRIILRCFATPETMPDIDGVRAEAMAGRHSFHAFKQRFNMAAALHDGTPNIACTRLHALYEECFPDRQLLADATGWSLETIAEIDAYRASPYVHCYPSREQVRALIPSGLGEARFVETSGYPLADHCPLLVIDLP